MMEYTKYKAEGERAVLLSVSADDILIVGTDMQINDVVKKLNVKYDLNDTSEVHDLHARLGSWW